MDQKERIQQQLWIIRLRKGDRSAFDELVAYWQRPLFYFVRRLVISEEDAYDVLQDVWIKVLQNIRAVKDEKAFPKWLYSITRNAAIDCLRRGKRLEPLGDESGTPSAEMEREPELPVIDAIDLHRALEQLPLQQREVLTLMFLEDFSVHEIAEITGASPGTVKSRLFYAKKRLRELLDQPGGVRGGRDHA